ncbi:hypothetical protein QBC44DRAFT_378937 [Cladorrhinum sp. PSN332]|nr:hypothetical protein QBC44DRAFT_378937 [Cladorrhinum sp. PSN332]
MRTPTLFALTGASLTVANVFALQNTANPALVRRQTATDDTENPTLASECSTLIESIVSARPVPSSDLNEWIVSQYDPEYTPQLGTTSGEPTTTNFVSVCSTVIQNPVAPTNPPASLSSELSSYTSAYLSWKSSAHPVVQSVASKCSTVGDYGRDGAGQLLWGVATDVPECLRAVELLYGQYYGEYTGPLPSPTGGNGDADQGAVQRTTDSMAGGAAGPRETGYVAKMAVAAVGAVVGAVAL